MNQYAPSRRKKVCTFQHACPDILVAGDVLGRSVDELYPIGPLLADDGDNSQPYSYYRLVHQVRHLRENTVFDPIRHRV